MEALTALQWAKEGYVPNADAVGEERWTNCFHGQKATYYIIAVKTKKVQWNITFSIASCRFWQSCH